MVGGMPKSLPALRPRLSPEVSTWVRERAKANGRTTEQQVDLMLRYVMDNAADADLRVKL